MKTYLKESWIDPRIETRQSSKGMGMFATAPIKEGEIVTIWGGTVFTNEEKEKGLVKKYTASRLDEDHWLGSALDEPDVDDQLLNHSCDPNIWMQDEVTFVARRDIEAGEEITADYSTWSIDENWVMDEECRCGSPLCRHRITGNDWKLPELQERYKDHFVPFINERIRLENSKDRWHILDRDGNPTKEEELPERPEDSNPAEGEAFRPWYKQDEHLHIEGGKIVGIHARGTLEEVQSRLRAYVTQEARILEHFGGNEDVLLPDADSFLNSLT
jgi:hypothetical protein